MLGCKYKTDPKQSPLCLCSWKSGRKLEYNYLNYAFLQIVVTLVANSIILLAKSQIFETFSPFVTASILKTQPQINWVKRLNYCSAKRKLFDLLCDPQVSSGNRTFDQIEIRYNVNQQISQSPLHWSNQFWETSHDPLY